MSPAALILTWFGAALAGWAIIAAVVWAITLVLT